MPDQGQPDSLTVSIRRVLKAQIVMTMALLAGVFVWSTPQAVLAAGYGAALGIFGTLISGRSARRSAEHALVQPGIALVPVYAGALQKLLMVAVGVALGLVALNLDPLFLVIGLALAQFGYVAAAVVRGRTD